MGLDEYDRKRSFDRTPEPSGERRAKKKRGGELSFVIQAHAARRMHYDFRLELDGVLLSWAIPKGPSLDPKVRRLAMHTEDHPLDYATFEGVIPKGEYGGGTVLVWDRGTWEPEGDPRAGHERGKLKFELRGEKLSGRWNLVRGREEDQWLLIKSRDEAARANGEGSIVDERPESVLTGRTLDEVTRDPDRVWHSRETGRPTPTVPDPADVKKAKRAKLPTRIAPELATLVRSVPRGPSWIHEIKLDGYRIVARLSKGQAKMLSRNGKDWTDRMPSVARAVAGLPVDDAVLDGEVVILDDRGVSDFQALQNALGAAGDQQAVYFVFDLLHLNGWDLRDAPLLERKELLADLLGRARDGRVRYGDHVEGNGEAFLARACEMGLEGIICKRGVAPYVGKRSRDWVKVKCQARQEFVIGGWTEPSGSRSSLGALLVGVHEGGELRYAGKVGTGFTAESLRQVLGELEPLERTTPPFANPPRGYRARGVHWVEPRKLAEVEFTGFTEDGRLRHPSFKGLREDEPAREIRREEPAMTPQSATVSLSEELREELRGVRLTSPDRELYPEDGITKKDLAVYYAQVAGWILPHVSDRLLSLVRCPEGHQKECFFQKHAKQGMSDDILTLGVRETKKREDYIYLQDLRGLLALVQMSTLEIHTWGSHVDRLERPDQLVFDLDPDEKLPWDRIVEAALLVRDHLGDLGLESWVKTTGGKGVHVVAPIQRRTGWDDAKDFTRAVAEQIEREDPKRYVSVMTKSKRKGRVFVDYLRNGRGATAVAAYSTRARPGAPVSTPITWEELEGGVRSDAFTIRDLPARLAELDDDPWEGFFDTRQSITKRMRRAVGLE